MDGWMDKLDNWLQSPSLLVLYQSDFLPINDMCSSFSVSVQVVNEWKEPLPIADNNKSPPMQQPLWAWAYTHLARKTAFWGCGGIWSTRKCHVTLLDTCNHWPTEKQEQREGLFSRWYMQTKANTRNRGHMLILLTFVMSDGTSHGLLPQPGKRREELLLVKNKKPFENKWCWLWFLHPVPLPLSSIHLFISFLIPCTSQQATVICMMWSVSAFSCSCFWSVCICLCVTVCRRVCLRVLIYWDWLPENLFCRVRSKKNTLNGNQENMHKSAALKACLLLVFCLKIGHCSNPKLRWGGSWDGSRSKNFTSHWFHL